MNPQELSEQIKTRALALGFDAVGIAPALPGAHAAFVEEWLSHGYAAAMAYLERDPQSRADPRRILPEARSLIVCAQGYYPGAEPPTAASPARGFVSRYARGGDYHDLLRAKLEALLAFLRDIAPKADPARCYVDTGPLLEREAAAQAGIGQFGKNSTLIHPTLGSFFFLGVILTAQPLAYDQPATASPCGRCRRCLDACPTGALREPYTLDANRCLSYLTIEHRGSIPRPLRPLMGNRVFGCDCCQEVCPWNHTPSITREREFLPRTEAAAPLLLELLQLSQEDFSRRFKGSPIKRAKRRGLLRNVAVALGNSGDPNAVPALTAALNDPEPLVRGHAAWALGQIGGEAARAALNSAVGVEADPEVRAEIALALADSAQQHVQE